VTRAAAGLMMIVALGVMNMATPREAPGTWRPLFDGKTTAGWRGFLAKAMPDGWKVVDGALTRVGKAGDIVTLDEFADFELMLDWKIAPRANSGIFYRVVENEEDESMWMVAPEYQLIDDKGYPQKLKDTQHTGANYDLQPPARDASKPAGEWNTTRIVAQGNHVEHWLNGVKLLEYEIGSPVWEQLVARSKFKDHPRYAHSPKGRIGIQDHGDWAAFRNIKIRELR
jgi:3-keto-disaccharide hydrolase